MGMTPSMDRPKGFWRASSRSAAKVVLVLACAISMSLMAAAQERRRRPPRLTKEEAQAIWKLQAQHVCAKLSLPAAKCDQLVTTYVDMKDRLAQTRMKRRAEVRAEFEALRARIADPDSLPGSETEEQREELHQALSAIINERMAEGNKERMAEREVFAKEVATFLTEAETKAVTERLKGGCWAWDRMVHTIQQLNLGEKQSDALEIVNSYVVEYAKLREATMKDTDEDFVELCGSLMGIRVARDRAMAKLLTEDQYSTWRKATQRPSDKPPTPKDKAEAK